MTNIDVMRFGADIQIILREETIMKKRISVLLALCLALALCAFAFAEASIFAGGSGTEDDPYQIATLEQFLAFAASVNDGSARATRGRPLC